MLLAQNTAGEITGVDVCVDFIDRFNQNFQHQNLRDRVKAVIGNMEDLPFDEEELDLIWSEGAIYNIGFDRGLNLWRKFLKPGGYIYIKDFYRKEVGDAELQQKIDKVINNIDKHYSYNTLRLAEVITALRYCNLEIQFIKKIEFADDTSIRAAFETHLNIDIFEGMPEFFPAEWLEIKVVKPL